MFLLHADFVVGLSVEGGFLNGLAKKDGKGAAAKFERILPKPASAEASEGDKKADSFGKRFTLGAHLSLGYDYAVNSWLHIRPEVAGGMKFLGRQEIHNSHWEQKFYGQFALGMPLHVGAFVFTPKGAFRIAQQATSLSAPDLKGDDKWLETEGDAGHGYVSSSMAYSVLLGGNLGYEVNSVLTVGVEAFWNLNLPKKIAKSHYVKNGEEGKREDLKEAAAGEWSVKAGAPLSVALTVSYAL